MAPDVSTTAPEVHQSALEEILEPQLEHGAEMWRIARDSVTLDLNSSYAYLVYCRDFARSCRVAVVGGQVAGFVLGHVPPDRTDKLFVWQIAVDRRYRGMGLATRMLESLVASMTATDGIRWVETTITADNEASQQLFTSFARRWNDAPMSVTPLFSHEQFPDAHDGEELYEIGPVRTAVAAR